MALELLRVARELHRIAGAIGVVRGEHRLVRRTRWRGGRCRAKRYGDARCKEAKSLQNHRVKSSMGMPADELKLWRKSQRQRLISARMALAPDSVESFRKSIDASIARAFPGLARSEPAFCWP